MISKLKNFFTGVFGKSVKEDELVEETRVIHTSGEITIKERNNQDKIEDNKGVPYVIIDKWGWGSVDGVKFLIPGNSSERLSQIILSQIRAGIIGGKYSYLNDWIEKNDCEFRKTDLPKLNGRPIKFYRELMGIDTDEIKKLKRVWRTRKYFTEDKDLQEYMTKDED